MLFSRVQEQSFHVFNSKQPQHSLGFPKYHPIQMWPCTKSCFNPVQVLTAVYLLTVMPQSLDIWSACLLNFKLSGWNTVEIFFWRSDTCSLPFFSLEEVWIQYILSASCCDDDKNFTTLLPVYLVLLCPRYDNVCRSQRNNEIYGKQAHRRKKALYDGSFIPCCCWTANGYQVCNRGWKAFKLCLLDNK